MLPGLGAAFTRDNLSRPAATVVKAIEEAGALIAGTRVYQGPYAGLFEHQLRPLFGFLTALAFADRHICYRRRFRRLSTHQSDHHRSMRGNRNAAR
jgi:hypothetical protein